MIDDTLRFALEDNHAGKSPADIAGETGIPVEQLTRFQAGEQSLTFLEAARVAEAYGLILGTPVRKRARRVASGPKKQRNLTALQQAIKASGWNVSEPTARKVFKIQDKAKELRAAGQTAEAEELELALETMKYSESWRFYQSRYGGGS